MAAPVNAPAAAPAAAPIDAARTLPVAAPPMIAPVAAPHAAPWPTGVSHEFRMQDVKTVTQVIPKMRVLILQLFCLFNHTRRPRLRNPPQHLFTSTTAMDKQRLCLL